MTPTPATHPSDDRIRDFLKGCLPEAAAAPLEEHLAACPDCAAALGRLDAGDGFLSRLRSAVAGTPLDSPDTPTAAPPHRADALGASLGPYRLVDRLGEGGMGVVYKAEQQHPLRRLVALKVVRPGLDGRRVVARFEAERQALALMDHPHIAKVLDAGAADDGRPYFVMELVEGAPLTTFCESHRLDIRARLALFVSVCEAVQHAHQKGIIHRDLKPSNLLVGGAADRPAPKVIDFGIAKAVGVRLTNATAATLQGQVVGTPDYMSPEQAEPFAEDIDTRADVYALGAVLYELLTGATPLQLARRAHGSFMDLLKAVCEEEPRRPSLVRREKGLEPYEELDWIVLKALEKERGRRYPTVQDLAADVGRYLRDEPVQACPPSPLYVLGKLARRHRRALATATAFVLLLVTATAVSVWQAVRARRAEAEAVATARKATEVNRFFTEDILPHAAPEFNLVGDQVTLLQVLDRAAAQVPDRFPDQPEVEAALRNAIGDAYLSLGAYAKAEAHFRAAVAAARRVGGADDPEAIHARSQLGYVSLKQRRLDEAETLLVPAAEGLARVRGEGSLSAIQALNHVGLLRTEQKQFAEADAAFTRALALAERTSGPEHFNTLTIRYNHIESLIARGQKAEAEPLLVEVEQVARRVWGSDHPVTLGLTNGLAHFHLGRGDFARSEPLFRDLLTSCRRALGPGHPHTLLVLTRLAEHHYHKKEYDEAEKLWDEVLDGRIRAYGPGHPTIANTIEQLLGDAIKRNRFARVEKLYERLLVTRRGLFGPEHQQVGSALIGLGVARIRLNRVAEAETTFREGLAVLERTAPASMECANARGQVGAALIQQKKFAEAEPLVLACYEGIKNHQGANPEQHRFALNSARERLVVLYERWGKADEAARWRAVKEP